MLINVSILNVYTSLNFLVSAFYPHLSPSSSLTTSNLSPYLTPDFTFDFALALSAMPHPVLSHPFFSSLVLSFFQLHSFFLLPPFPFPSTLLLSETLPLCPCSLLTSVSFHDSIALSSPHHSPNSTMLVHCMVEKARSSENLHCPTSRLGPRTFWWLQMWQVVVSTSKMCLWWSTMIWPKTLKVSVRKVAATWGKGDSLYRSP